MDTIPVGSRLTLHLGVVVLPYRSTGNLARTLGVKKINALTTGDVAEILEAKYGIFAAFYRSHEDDIAKDIENSLQGAMESLLMHKAVDPWGAAMQSIQQRWRDFISTSEAERIGIPGTPTKAALMGVSHRYKHPYAKHPRRPSFRDTGTYMNSGRFWID
jgi:hypothetical protein